MDFSIFYKDQLTIADFKNLHWDTFISGFNSSGRVQKVFASVKASEKHWVVFPEYGYNGRGIPRASFASGTRDEASFIKELIATKNINLKGTQLCIDITGFI